MVGPAGIEPAIFAL